MTGSNTDLTLATAVAHVVGYIDKIIPVLVLLALVLFFWGCVQYIRAAGGEESKNYRATIIWGLISLFVIFSVWGILNTACSTLLGGTHC